MKPVSPTYQPHLLLLPRTLAHDHCICDEGDNFKTLRVSSGRRGLTFEGLRAAKERDNLATGLKLRAIAYIRPGKVVASADTVDSSELEDCKAFLRITDAIACSSPTYKPCALRTINE